jgi:hypothetical protein
MENCCSTAICTLKAYIIGHYEAEEGYQRNGATGVFYGRMTATMAALDCTIFYVL